jgi:hypothetical protein
MRKGMVANFIPFGYQQGVRTAECSEELRKNTTTWVQSGYRRIFLVQ